MQLSNSAGDINGEVNCMAVTGPNSTESGQPSQDEMPIGQYNELDELPYPVQETQPDIRTRTVCLSQIMTPPDSRPRQYDVLDEVPYSVEETQPDRRTQPIYWGFRQTPMTSWPIYSKSEIWRVFQFPVQASAWVTEE